MKRYIRAGVLCPRCGAIGKGQVLKDDLHGDACLQCAYIPGDAVKRYDPSARRRDEVNGRFTNGQIVSPAVRFFAKVNLAGPISDRRPDLGPCWLWTGTLSKWGYGDFTNFDSHTAAHRFSYEYHIGLIPLGFEVDHLCFVRACVNPQHLEAVTKRENILRGDSPPAKAALATHCPQGHSYDLFNTYYRPDGRRLCRTCNRENVARIKARKQAEAGRPDPVRRAPRHEGALL